LGRIDMAGLPLDLFPKVYVPEEVAAELLVKDSPDSAAIQALLERVEVIPARASFDPLLIAELDRGEASVIAGAKALGVRNVLIDERKARRIASAVFGLTVRGSAGLLLEAKRRGLIPVVRPCLESMISGGYFISDAVVAACVAAAGEI
jgi:predicted nucleic acid-binding protein